MAELVWQQLNLLQFSRQSSSKQYRPWSSDSFTSDLRFLQLVSVNVSTWVSSGNSLSLKQFLRKRVFNRERPFIAFGKFSKSFPLRSSFSMNSNLWIPWTPDGIFRMFKFTSFSSFRSGKSGKLSKEKHSPFSLWLTSWCWGSWICCTLRWAKALAEDSLKMWQGSVDHS